MHIIFKHIWNIVKDRPHISTQNKPQQTKIIEITLNIFSEHNGMKLEIIHRKKTSKKPQLHGD